ncbi:MAG: T9SS type A sorting domain-containing protein, partial [Candidatus Marinimicrobia bacterium]|nr:T9SS type A sorting domain-containing protein [Candidatus Neomarinimicrobiota bacterium]
NSNFTIEKATLSLFKLGDTTPNGCAGMKIIGDQTVMISAQNIWTTVGNYTLNSANLWSLSSNVFTLNSTNAYGYYFLEYSVSLMTANTGGDDIEMGVFIGTTLNSELTLSRRLSSETDVGIACGIGLFYVNGPDSTITLKIRNTTSTNNLTIKKSLVGFSQIRYVYSDVPLPIVLRSFNVEQQGNVVKLSWETASETENLGFNLYRKEDKGSFHIISSYTDNPNLWGCGTSSETHSYLYIDSDVEVGIHYTYMLSDVSYNTIEEKHYQFSRQVYLPLGIDLGEVFPNPFNPKFIIPFTLDTQQHVTIHLLNAQGIKIRTLTNAEYTPGSYQIPVYEPSLSSGIYFIQVQAGDQSEIQKIVMIK